MSHPNSRSSHSRGVSAFETEIRGKIDEFYASSLRDPSIDTDYQNRIRSEDHEIVNTLLDFERLRGSLPPKLVDHSNDAEIDVDDHGAHVLLQGFDHMGFLDIGVISSTVNSVLKRARVNQAMCDSAGRPDVLCIRGEECLNPQYRKILEHEFSGALMADAERIRFNEESHRTDSAKGSRKAQKKAFVSTTQLTDVALLFCDRTSTETGAWAYRINDEKLKSFIEQYDTIAHMGGLEKDDITKEPLLKDGKPYPSTIAKNHDYDYPASLAVFEALDRASGKLSLISTDKWLAHMCQIETRVFESVAATGSALGKRMRDMRLDQFQAQLLAAVGQTWQLEKIADSSKLPSNSEWRWRKEPTAGIKVVNDKWSFWATDLSEEKANKVRREIKDHLDELEVWRCGDPSARAAEAPQPTDYRHHCKKQPMYDVLTMISAVSGLAEHLGIFNKTHTIDDHHILVEEDPDKAQHLIDVTGSLLRVCNYVNVVAGSDLYMGRISDVHPEKTSVI